MKSKVFRVLIALVLALSFSMVMAAPAAADTLEVGSGKTYTTIQEAIDVAGSGDTIVVDAGTYTEDLTVNIANLTIQSADGAATTIIQLVDGVGIDIQGGASGFILGGVEDEGFTIQSSSGAGTTFNIQLANAPSDVTISYNTIDTTGGASMGVSVGAAGATGLTISDNTFTGDDTPDGSIWGPDVVDVTVTNNVFTGLDLVSYGVQFDGISGTSVINGNTVTDYKGAGAIVILSGTGVSGLTINDNTISGCANGIRFYDDSGTGDITTVTVTENTLTDNAKAIMIGNGAHIVASDFVIEDNNISGSTSYGLQNEHSSKVVTAENNWWGNASGPTHATNPSGTGDVVTDRVDFTPWLDAAYPGGSATGYPVYNSTTAEGYETIQEAIDDASAGDTISVAEGTYTENIVVDKALTLESSGEVASTIIDAADASDYVVEITADSVTLDGFTITGIDNSTENMAAVILQGVDYGTITSNILTDNHRCAINLFSTGGEYSDYNTVSNNVINGPAGKDSRGIKIKGSHNTISGNEVYNIDNPILIWSWNDSETASPDYNTVSNNTIGPGDDTAAHKYGVKIKTGHHNVVTGNTITDATEAAIYLYTSSNNAPEEDFDPRPASDNISGNIITGGKVGIALLDGANNNNISGNTISGTTLAGILGALSQWPEDFTDGPSSYLVGTPQQYLQIVSNTIEDNNITDCGHGIAMVYSDDNTLTGNTIEDNAGAAAISWESISFDANGRGVFFDANSAGNTVNYNNISGNTDYGLESGAAIDAENNWWGNASGPVPDPLPAGYESYGDKVKPLTNVDAEPWLLAEAEVGVTPTTYEKTLALKDVWTMVSVDKEVTTGSDWVGTDALAGTATIIAYKYTAGTGYTQVILATQLTSVDACYVKTDGGGGVGINYSTSAPGVVTKELGAGWNTISCAGETDAYRLLSQVRYVQIGEQQGVGITNLIGQANYNQYRPDSFNIPLVTDAEWAIISPSGEAVTLNAFDGYWVYMNAAKSFGVIPE